MWFRLTLALGHKSVRDAQAHITAREFGAWCAYYGLEPFGSRAEDKRAGTIAATIANVQRSKSTSPYEWKDFFPETAKPTPTWQELLTKVIAANKTLGGKDTRKKQD